MTGTYGYHVDPLIDEAIAATFRTHPYYAQAVRKLRIVADESVPTMATSAQWVTHYNPATVAGWTPAERAAVLVHELEHLLRDHHGRCGDRDPQGFNVAGDAEINQPSGRRGLSEVSRDAGWTLGRNVLLRHGSGSQA